MNYLGLKRERLEKTANEMNRLLANYQIYYQNLRNFHWNVQGENFFDLHEKFETMYEDARGKIDDIAERILTLRYRPLSSLSMYLSAADIDEAGKMDNDREMVDMLLDNHRILIENFRSIIKAADEIEDEGTIDMIGGFLEELEKESWMLDAWRAKVGEPAMA